MSREADQTLKLSTKKSSLRWLAAALGLTLLLPACDRMSHPADLPAFRAQRNTTGGSSTESPTTGTSSPVMAQFIPGSPPLKTYDTTFVTHQGWKKNFVIFHEDGNYFMVLDVPASAQFIDADGNPVPDGAEVNIRAVVDSSSVSFEFQPHGSYFTGSRPVVLWVYLKYVELGSSGPLPGIWYQADSTEPWAQLSTAADRAGNWLKVELRHFSNYAVAW